MKVAVPFVYLAASIAGGCATPHEVPVDFDGYRTGETISLKECERRSGSLLTSPDETVCSLALVIIVPSEPSPRD
jgi:hypothetical protein